MTSKYVHKHKVCLTYLEKVLDGIIWSWGKGGIDVKEL